MKYNEAIDMILDGGDTYRKGKSEYKQTFRWSDTLFGDYLNRLSGGFWEYRFIVGKEDFTETDWIVEKDGVVYEEYPGTVISREMIAGGWKHNIPDGLVKVTLYAPPVELHKIPMTEYGFKKLDMLLESGDLLIDERGTPLERVRNGQPKPSEIEEPKKISIDEDWLEKKMLCFLNRALMSHIQEVQVRSLADYKLRECPCKDCPFCLPKEQPKPDHIPEVINMVYCNNHKDKEAVISFCKECFQEKQYEQKRHKELREQPREKVTYAECILFLDEYIAYCRLLLKANYIITPESEQDKIRDNIIKSRRKLEKRFEYLVSLQEK